MVSQDPVVSRAKLIAEPWDVGQFDSYDLGGFPPRGASGTASTATACATSGAATRSGLGEFASRFCGSSDLYSGARRRPTASVNLITVHDGFTLRDLVSYNDKHNEANGESNRDGTSDNRSWNCGAEGPTTDPGRAGAAGAPVPRDAHHPAAVVRDPDAARRRRDGPHPAGQQQRLLPGQRDLLVSTGRSQTRSCWTSPGGSSPSGWPTRCSAAAASWPGRRHPSCAGSPPRAPR